MDSGQRDTVWVNRISIATIFLTGFSGLVYEVIWQRYLANLFGSEAKSTCVILAVFLGGLAVGYRLFGKLSPGQSSRALVKLCGICEIGIGIWAFMFPQLYSFVWGALGVVNPESAFSTVYEVLLGIALIGVPTILMGCTLPLLTQGLSTTTSEVPKMHARIYAWNTGGAFLGCLSAGFVLLPIFGLPITIMTVALVNIVAGITLLGLGTGLSSEETEPTKAIAKNDVNYLAIAVAFAAGFVGITFQILLMRVAGLSLGSSDYTFSMIVAIYILMLAFGASRLRKSKGPVTGTSLISNQLLLIIGLAAFYFVVPYMPYLILLTRTTFSASIVAFYAYYIAAGLLFGLILFIPLAAIGKGMPLLLGFLKPQISNSGDDVGKIYFWNSVGCVFGALIGGYGLLAFMNLDSVLKIAVAIAALSLVLMTVLAKVSVKVRSCFAGGLALLVTVSVFVPKWSDYFLGIGLFRTSSEFPSLYQGRLAAMKAQFSTIRVIARQDDPNTSVSISEDATPSINGTPFTRSIIVNGKSDGSTAGVDMITTRMLAHLPMMLSRGNSHKVAVVGFGTGATSGELALYPEVSDVDCIEISSAVQKLSSNFSFINHDVTTNPKFHWHRTDAYRFLASSSEKYRVIVSEPSNPWVGGVERLYSKEFYSRARDSLDHNGIFAQWFHSYSVSDQTQAMVLNTLSSAFRYTRVFSINGFDMIILGSEIPIGFQVLADFENRWNEALSDIRRDLDEIGVKYPEQLLGSEIPITGAAFSSAETHTLEFPKLSFSAGKDFFKSSHADLQALIKNELLRPWVGAAISQTLISQWIALHPSKQIEEIRHIAQIKCNLINPTLLSSWRNAPAECKNSLLALVSLGGIKTDSTLDPRLLEWVQKFMGQSSHKESTGSSSGSKVTEAKIVLHIFEDNNSPVTRFSAAPLVQATQPCFVDSSKESLQCRTQLVEVLVNNGFLKEAQRQLALLTVDVKVKSTIPMKTLDKLEAKIALGAQAQNAFQ